MKALNEKPMVYEEFVEFLSREMPPQAVIDFRPSPQNQARFDELVESSKSGSISRDEQRELEQFLMLEHVLRLLKAKARARQSKPEAYYFGDVTSGRRAASRR